MDNGRVRDRLDKQQHENAEAKTQ
eukprot:SAG11_NODE_28755_length_318_cov_0.789954_1_plen_23_part_10